MKGNVNRLIDKVGRDLSHTYFEKVGEDDYGENYEQYSETITGRITRAGTIQQERSQHSAAIDVDSTIYIKTDDAANVNDGGGDGASEFDVDGNTYIVLQSANQDNGLTRLDCQVER